MGDPWDIPEPGCFQSCPPPPSEDCEPCQTIRDQQFDYPVQSVGVPYGRVRVPLMRVNGQIQDMFPGEVLAKEFVEPPSLSWDAKNHILNVGGRYIKLTGL